MKCRTTWVVGLLLICSALTFASPARAQGAMYDSWPDGNGDIYTEVFSTQVAYCSTSYVWSDFVGADGTQYSGGDVIQWVTSAPPGTDYTWYFGGTIYAPNPYGYCSAYQWNITATVKLTTTYWGGLVVSGDNCDYFSLACLPGTNPTCTGISNGVFLAPCPPYVASYWVVIRINNTQECLNVFNQRWTAPGKCT
jgi:hypothetical protein